MAEKPKPAKRPKPPTQADLKHWGEMKEPVYREGLGRKVGGWLTGLLTVWKR